MRKLLPVLPFVCLSLCLSAQISISVSPGVTSGSGLVTSPDIGAYTKITNNSLVPVNLLWSREVVNMPVEWQSWICDMNNCYLPFVSRCPDSQPNYLEPGQSMNLEIHVGPGGVDGEAELKLDFFELDNPDEILGTVQVFFETSATSLSDLNTGEIRIFPNPTTSYFQLNDAGNVGQIVMYSMVGNRMRAFDARSTNRFDVSDLPQGIYLVRILDPAHNVLRTVRLSKR